MSRVLAGRYELGPLIGRGGMATVHRARDRALDRDVAIKLISEGASRERFLVEARRTAQIRHPSVIEIFDVRPEPGTDAGDGGEAFLVMPLLAGESLQIRLEREGRLSPEETVAIGIETCDALAAAHALGIVHRDVKPANLFLLASGSPEQRRVKVLDFGVAKRMDSNTLETEEGMLVGTIAYMAPEQIRGEEIDPRGDLYSLGVVLFRCLSGSLPFERSNAAAMIHAHLNVEPPHLPQAGPALLRLDGVLQQLLAKSRADRPADAVATRALLAEALSGEGAALLPASSPAESTVPAIGELELGPDLVETRLELGDTANASAQVDFEIDHRPLPATHVAPRLPVLLPYGAAPLEQPGRRPVGFLEGFPTEVSKRIAGYSALVVVVYSVFFKVSAWLLVPLVALGLFGLVAYVKASNRSP